MMISLVVCVVLLSVLICAIIGIQMYQSTIRRYDRFITQQVLTIDKTLDTFMQNGKNMVSSLSKQRLLQESTDKNLPNFVLGGADDLDEENREHYDYVIDMFAHIKDTYSEIEEAFMGTKWGTFAASNKDTDLVGFDPRKRSWFKDATSNPDKIILTPTYVSASGKPVVSLAKAVFHENGRDVIGAVGIDVSLSKLDAFMSSIKIGKTGYCLLIEESGNILVDPKHKDAVFKTLQNCGIASYAKIDSVKVDEPFVLNVDGVNYQSQVYPAKALNSRLVILVERSELLDIFYVLLNYMSFITLGLLLASIVISVFCSRGLKKYFEKLEVVFKKIAKGDTTARINYQKNDEIGNLMHYFNISIEHMGIMLQTLV